MNFNSATRLSKHSLDHSSLDHNTCREVAWRLNMAGCCRFSSTKNHPKSSSSFPKSPLPRTQKTPSPDRVGLEGGAVTWASLAPKTKSVGRTTRGRQWLLPPPLRPVRGPLVKGAGHRVVWPPVEPEQGRPVTDSTHPSSPSFPTPHPITTSPSSPWRFLLQQPGRGVLATTSRPAGPCEGQPTG